MPKSLASTSSISEIPFSRKRLQSEQVAVLQGVFEENSHPSPEERAGLAAELGLELKAVNVWYQNKRRSVKKQTLAWKPTVTKQPLYRKASTQMSMSRASSTSNVTVSRSSISLDSVVESRERPDTAPRTPPRSRRTTSISQAARPPQIWELIPSSPNLPPSSPAAESARLAALPVSSKTMRSLEWACAKDRAGRKKRKRRHGAMDIYDVPPLPSLQLDSLKDGTDTEMEELITPDTSMELASFQTPVHKRLLAGEDSWVSEESRKENEPPEMHVEAAIALLGIKVRSS
ncbi:hypothetical protein BXZ70DRAFT_943373 [Cristinia sonorae]|uniref:Homeobox domain-containing protein n=1 Tax=Cristinia sonorae TaxID=1940300 RepID=A0A8K0UNF8_9AGAR|nr:hypothetical protein BXZ70DRAFT_943373 [Cristinia sonorae]